VAVKKAMQRAPEPAVSANYLASIVDGLGIGITSAGKIEHGVGALVVQEAVVDAITV
jgi:hypothetical protein